MAHKIDADSCAQCGVCESTCTASAISMVDDKYVIDIAKCNDCAACSEACPVNCISGTKK